MGSFRTIRVEERAARQFVRQNSPYLRFPFETSASSFGNFGRSATEFGFVSQNSPGVAKIGRKGKMRTVSGAAKPDPSLMRRDYHNWYSQRLGRNMELLAYGHAGLPVLVFPSSRGRFFEYEDRGMIHAIWQRIDAGNFHFFCVDSIDSESWYNRGIHPHDRVMRHNAYESYLLYEVLPLIRGVNGSGEICSTGCSFGAYHAFNFAMKHPDIATSCVSMSGAFEMKSFMDGYYDSDFYFNNPVDYIPNMSDPWFLDHYKKMKIILAAGDWDICLGDNFNMAHLLGSRGIPHWLDVWTGGEKHDWPLWQRMAVKFFS